MAGPGGGGGGVGSKKERRGGFREEVLRAGTGPKPVKGQKVTVHCTGYGKDRDLSKKFWSTKDPGQQPFSFNIGLGSVIKVHPGLCLWSRRVSSLGNSAKFSACIRD
uniref:peptidylprolyl isomerase n=1 Tax=Arundo donax TaxID=35708 RepID=A0A0A9GEF0_ARUDO